MSESQSQTEFFELISKYPAISVFWNRPEKSCKVEALKKRMGTMSHGEIVMSKFFMSVWFGKNTDFDFLEAASALDGNERVVIAKWLVNPFWP